MKELLGNKIGLEIGDLVPFDFNGDVRIGKVAELVYHEGKYTDSIRATVDFGNGAIIDGCPDSFIWSTVESKRIFPLLGPESN